jgi:hypothetical protein
VCVCVCVKVGDDRVVGKSYINVSDSKLVVRT